MNKENMTNEIVEETAATEATQVSLSDNARIISPGQLVLRRFFRSKLSLIGLAMLVVMFVFCLIGPFFATWGESEIDYSNITEYGYSQVIVKDADGNEHVVYQMTSFTTSINKYAKPFTKSQYYTKEVVNADGEKETVEYPERMHILGTDENGRDVFTRLMYGGQKSILLSLMTVALYLTLGILLGSLAGYVGGWVDQIIMRIVDVINCIPSLPIMLILAAMLEGAKVPQEMRIYYLMAILTLLSWTGIARLVRGQILFLREQEYMVAADALGLPATRKIFKHLIPNIVPQLIVTATLGLGSMILYESTLSYLGLGFPLEIASWGRMVNSATTFEILKNYPHIWVPAGICIIITVLGFNFMGDGLRDALDPKMKR
jgi:peptide/nickel transport system permease protein